MNAFYKYNFKFSIVIVFVVLKKIQMFYKKKKCIFSVKRWFTRHRFCVISCRASKKTRQHKLRWKSILNDAIAIWYNWKIMYFGKISIIPWFSRCFFPHKLARQHQRNNKSIDARGFSNNTDNPSLKDFSILMKNKNAFYLLVRNQNANAWRAIFKQSVASWCTQMRMHFSCPHKTWMLIYFSGYCSRYFGCTNRLQNSQPERRSTNILFIHNELV